MKKTLILLALTLNFSVARADFSAHIDIIKIGQLFLEMTEDLNNNLEALHQLQNEALPIQEKWDIMCEVAQSLNKGTDALNVVLAKYKVNQQWCAPITQSLSLQSAIIKNCQSFYSKPVPDSAKYLISKFGLSIIQSKMALTTCYPELANIVLTGSH